MTIAARHICLAIVLGVLASHAGIAVHTASHLSDDSGECEYCMAYGDSVYAADTVHEQAAPELTLKHVSPIHTAPATSSQVLPFRPRDPPLAD